MYLDITCLEIIMCKAVEIGRKGDALRCHPGIKNLILSINGNLDIHFDKYKNSKAFCYW
jgi:hypothetical protein